MQQTTLTDRIKFLRTTLKLSQTDFGKKLGKNYHSVMRWELGKVLPPANVMEHICNTFGVRMQWLESGSGEIFISRQNTTAADAESVVYSAENAVPLYDLLKTNDTAQSIMLPGLKDGMFAVCAPADCAVPVMPGDITICSPANKAAEGELCLVRGEYGDLIIRWAYDKKLVSKRPEYPDIPMDSVSVEGVIKEIYRKIIF